MIRKFVESMLKVMDEKAPLTQKQFLDYATRDYQTHSLILILLIILCVLMFAQAWISTLQ
ncbi:MAG: hypothetical protein OXI24_05660 [Candidatus Poribacteria bacterium]|nr:hypothetical protein [Candidatus Poribacteria bacterium]